LLTSHDIRKILSIFDIFLRMFHNEWDSERDDRNLVISPQIFPQSSALPERGKFNRSRVLARKRWMDIVTNVIQGSRSLQMKNSG